jgi:hypothetical protein
LKTGFTDVVRAGGSNGVTIVEEPVEVVSPKAEGTGYVIQ